MRIVASPGPGEKLARYVGDRISFSIAAPESNRAGFSAFLRTNLGQAEALRKETISSLHGPPPLAGAAWRDVPMRWDGDAWRVDVSLTEVGFFNAKPYLLDADGHQHWPHGANIAVSAIPDGYRTGNTIYCAFTRLFGETKTAQGSDQDALAASFGKLDKLGYAVIPPSGKFRDLIREFPHIFDTLGCKILHLLPVNPVPTTYARFGRFGSPYAAQDLTAVDPALVEFDKRTTGIEQFCELTHAAHARGGKVFLDMVINHTGWGSSLQENHPEWFLREANGKFHSPGAWDVVWEDLVEMNHQIPDSWDHLAEAFVTWCRRGVDGFRCDAGYKVPEKAWAYITARVRQEFPETLFLLEGLGGSWEATEALLQGGGMQWAYSELFQNYSGIQVGGYLDHSIQQSERTGILAHYSETHDNNRLAAQGPVWSKMRNALCALTSVSGAYGFTCGVEWLSADKIFVHQSPGLSWGSSANIIPELRELNQLLGEHPCFFDGAALRRVSPMESPVYALERVSADKLDRVLVLVNLDPLTPRIITFAAEEYDGFGEPRMDLILKTALTTIKRTNGSVEIQMAPGGYHCLAGQLEPRGLAGSAYRDARARASWAIKALGTRLTPEELGPHGWRELAGLADESPEAFLGSLPHIDPVAAAADLMKALRAAQAERRYPTVVVWKRSDASRMFMAPPHHWLVVRDAEPFHATLQMMGHARQRHAASIPVRGGQVACFAPLSDGEEWRPESEDSQPHSADQSGEGLLTIEGFGASRPARARGHIRFLSAAPRFPESFTRAQLQPPSASPKTQGHAKPMALLTNGIGGMARVCVDLGSVQSKYDCLLAANLHPSVPCDRHVFVKRLRVWINANGFISPLNEVNLRGFKPGPPAVWRFSAMAGGGHVVPVEITMDMLDGKNTVAVRFHRPEADPRLGRQLPPGKEVRLILRFDIEDRNFHSETRRNPGSEAHFTSHSRPLLDGIGFEFTPAADRHLRVEISSGLYHPAPEWSEEIPHPIEQTRGQTGHGDAFSPGWFAVPLRAGATETALASANIPAITLEAAANFGEQRVKQREQSLARAEVAPGDTFGRRLAVAMQAFVVQRNFEKTVIAGYPWFLDWGRDSLICARGLLAAGMVEEVRQLLLTFGRFERDGTLPNIIHGEDASNRETSDAPLWYGIVCQEAAQVLGPELYQLKVDSNGRTILDVLASLGKHYYSGAANGIHADEQSGLVWSPSHFTWMDTNYPAGTPREGYPIEIQALWIHLLRQLHQLRAAEPSSGVTWASLAEKAERSLGKYFWLEKEGWFADLIIARSGTPAHQGVLDSALRSNCLFVVTLGLATPEQARRCVQAAAEHLVVPGALRSLAPLPAALPHAIYGNDSTLLNDPARPYAGRYEGDEDTRRKPAYHNGTAWTWTFPSFCEALAKAYPDEAGRLAARAYLASAEQLLMRGSLGQLPEIVDGDWPHEFRGCDAQAWGATEAFRVWRSLNH